VLHRQRAQRVVLFHRGLGDALAAYVGVDALGGLLVGVADDLRAELPRDAELVQPGRGEVPQIVRRGKERASSRLGDSSSRSAISALLRLPFWIARMKRPDPDPETSPNTCSYPTGVGAPAERRRSFI
jgi:hypothetical protein